MLLRHAYDNDNRPIENAFEAVDDGNGELLGSCTILVSENEELFPKRPVRIFLELEGECFPDGLLGAAVARAKEIARDCKRPCRIFTTVEPENRALMASLELLGFKDNDGLISMRREPAPAEEIEIPVGCVVVRDFLADPREQEFFLERYNRLYAEDESEGEEWLLRNKTQEGFLRILIVSPQGMVGETIIHRENGEGFIDWLFVSRKWRHLHTSRMLLDLACDELAVNGASSANARIQARIPYVLRTLENALFRQDRLICRYPGIDIG